MLNVDFLFHLKVIFIKYDNKVLSSGSAIREDSDDERFEIGQQYAWEWSLKINSINEDDSGLYFCKVANTVIKKFEIIVRVPPRIKDDLMSAAVTKKSVREGDTVEFACFASGTPRPNITWYVYSASEQAFKLMPHISGSYLKIDNVNRYTARRYQCRASNNIPPSDTRNLTFAVECMKQYFFFKFYKKIKTFHLKIEKIFSLKYKIVH